jgi:plastocyanin
MTGRCHSKLLIPVMLGFLLLSFIAVSACSQTAPAPPVTPTPAPSGGNPGTLPGGQQTSIKADVALVGFAFSPGTVTIPVGATVIWTNKDSATHTVTSDTGVFDSGNLARDAVFAYTFSKAGTYSYHCNIHPSMTGKIVVQ